MKLKIAMNEFIEVGEPEFVEMYRGCKIEKVEGYNRPFTEEDSIIHIDELLTQLLTQKPFGYPKRCIKRTDEPNVVEIGDFATVKAEKLDNPKSYAKTLLNLTFGKNYSIVEV